MKARSSGDSSAAEGGVSGGSQPPPLGGSPPPAGPSAPTFTPVLLQFIPRDEFSLLAVNCVLVLFQCCRHCIGCASWACTAVLLWSAALLSSAAVLSSALSS